MLGLPAPIKGLRIVPHRPLVLLTTTMCPKRRPPRPKHPKFTHFHRSGLRFGRFPAQHRSIGGVGGRRKDRRAWLRCPWAAGPGRASRRRADQRPGPAGVEGAGRTGGPGCGARGRWRGLAGLRAAGSRVAISRAGRRPRAHQAARPRSRIRRHPEHPWGLKRLRL